MRFAACCSWTEIPPGQDLTYSLGYSNHGNVTMPNLQLTDPPNPTAAGNPFDQLEIVSVTTDGNPRTLKFTVQLYDPAAGTWVDYVPPDTALLTRAKGIRLRAPDGVPVGGFMRATVTVRLRPGITSGRLRNCVNISVDGTTSADPSCSEEVDVRPAKAAASLQKTLDPETVLRPVTGVAPQDVSVRLTTLNSGNIGLKRLVVTDTDPGFFDAVTVTRLAGVTFPNGADQVQVDVCTTGCTAKPPVFVAGTPTGSTTPGFPSGVSPADIQGIRVTFSSSAGGYAILPATSAPGYGGCPNSSVCLVVQPRSALRSDATKPIPDTLPDTASGAGESRLQPDGSTFPIPDSSATLNVREGSNQVRVEKEPAQSVLSPGAAAPFNLHIRNTGTAPVPDLVVVDEVPGGLRFDDAFQGDKGLPYTLRYTLPPGAKEPSQVLFEPVRDASGRITKLRWRFPGWLLYPAEEVVVGYQVKLAGGVAAGTAITNTFGAGSATAAKLNCDPGSPRLGQAVDDPRYGPGTFCTSNAEVVSRSGVSFDAAKWVTGDRALGYQDANTGAPIPAGDPRCPELTVAGAVYTRYPCVAVGPFTLAYACLLTTASGDQVEMRAGEVRFDPARPFELGAVPAGAVCRFWETDSAGAQSDHQGEANAVVVTVTPAADATTWQQEEISNQYPRRDLVIAKRITGEGAALVGDGPFKVTVDCAFNGTRLSGFPQELVFRRDGSQAVTGLPQGSSCDAVETDNGGASHVRYEVTRSARVQLSPRPGEIEEPGPAGGPTTVIITNEFPVGSLTVTKKLTGQGGPLAQGPFHFQVSCDFNGRTAVLTRELRLSGPDHLTGRLDHLPVGALCTVTETDSGGADAPAKPVHGVVIKEGDTDLATAELSNTFSAGRLTLAKQLTGPLAQAPYLKDAAFTLHVLCRRDGHDVLNRTVTLHPATPVTLPGLLLVGTRCWAAELNSGATSTIVDHPDEAHAAESP